ncbi:MAG: hypothetical protein GYA22_05885 [Bacteroidales bacterium]|nr:hypothetical protein [Bacteroidales bacterium]
MNAPGLIIIVPILAGLLLLCLPSALLRIKAWTAMAVSLFALAMAFMVIGEEKGLTWMVPFLKDYTSADASGKLVTSILRLTALRLDAISVWMTILAAFYAWIVSVYTLSSGKEGEPVPNFHGYVLITLGFAAGALLCDHLLFFLFCWGVLGLTLFMLIRGNNDEQAAAAKKSLIMIGASDSLMILGIGLLWIVQPSMNISGIHLGTDTPLAVGAFLCLLAGSLTKAGAFPFHTWVPDFAETGPAASSAFLPASVDKLLGIYLLARLCLGMFILNEWLVFLIILTGSVTIIAGVMMALAQHKFKKLLGYHAVSQVGYMILGIGIGTPVGIAGGLFHLFNNALYKTGLFLSAGNVEKQTGTDDIDQTGGLAAFMPFTFASSLVFALAISGVPPLNGFASKWLIYQGVIDLGSQGGVSATLWPLWLGMAVLGSALTLASFIKFLTGIFLGARREELASVKESNGFQCTPPVTLALLCLASGILASGLVIPRMIMPLYQKFDFVGFWNSELISILVILSFVLGFLFYAMHKLVKIRVAESFTGGEPKKEEKPVVVGDFYLNITRAPFFEVIYRMAEKKWFDIYAWGKELVLATGKGLSILHTGLLPLYVLWAAAGLIILLLVFL